MPARSQFTRESPPVTLEDIAGFWIQPQFPPSIDSTILWAEKSLDGSPPLRSVDAENIAEILDKVVSGSSPTVNPSLKKRCFRVLRKISPMHGVLPRSYCPPGVTLKDSIPYASGGFTNTWEGLHDGNPVCVKGFRTDTAANLEKIKRRFYREIIAWKYVSHPNVIPFIGVSSSVFSFGIITPWLQNGNIVEYIQKHEGANRLQLLAQATCGLEYLHSVDIVHSDINPGNILITEEGNACLGDYGITGIIADTTVIEPGSTTTSKPGVVRYMAPELLNPSQFGLLNSSPSKESDVYSLVMTAYETLTEILPYGSARDGTIIFHVVAGDRPPRPTNTRWVHDHTWNMINTCWSGRREQRWNVHAIYDQFSTSSVQVLDIEPDLGMAQTPDVVAVTLPKDLSPAQPSMKLEVLLEPDHPVRQETGTELSNCDKRLRLQTAPVSNTPKRMVSRTGSMSPSPPSNVDNASGPGVDLGVQGRRARGTAILSRGRDQLRVIFNVLTAFLRSRKPGADERPSR